MVFKDDNQEMTVLYVLHRAAKVSEGGEPGATVRSSSVRGLLIYCANHR
jgi:hypothetical protein